MRTSLYGDLFSRRKSSQNSKSSSPPSSTAPTSTPSTAPPSNTFTVLINKGIQSTGLGYSTDLSFRNVFISSIEEYSPLRDSVQVGDVIIGIGDAMVDAVVDAMVDGVADAKIDANEIDANNPDSNNPDTNNSDNNNTDNNNTDNNNIINTIDMSFDQVMNLINNALLNNNIKGDEQKEEQKGGVLITFFRGDDKSLMKEKTPETAVVRVKEEGRTREIEVKTGRSLRDILIENGINPYQSIARYTNCKGKQLCGTCIVNVPSNSHNCNRKSLDEAAALRENAESYRLSCVTFVYGDVEVEVRPPVNPSQWTR